MTGWVAPEWIERIRERDPERARRYERNERRRQREDARWPERRKREQADLEISLRCEMRAESVRGLTTGDWPCMP